MTQYIASRVGEFYGLVFPSNLSYILRTKLQHLNVSRHVLQLSSPNPLEAKSQVLIQ